MNVPEENKKCKSLYYFAKNYLTIQNPDGTTRKPNEHELAWLKMVEKAQNEGKSIVLRKGRGTTTIEIE